MFTRLEQTFTNEREGPYTASIPDRVAIFLVLPPVAKIVSPAQNGCNVHALVEPGRLKSGSATGSIENRGRIPLTDRLFEPVPIAPLVFFRLAFGGLVLYDVLAKTFSGSVHRNLIAPEFHFRYFGFEWVPNLPGNFVYLLVAVIACSLIGFILGAFYRLSAIVFFLGISWYFLIDQTTYLNHYYLVCLLAFIAIFLPANRSLSIDVKRNPALQSDISPAWTLWLVLFQMGVVYFFGGIAKMNRDWLIAGEPLRTWLSATELPPFTQTEFAVYLLAWGGLLFDLSIVPLLLWKKTRMVAFTLAVLFHVTNAFLFQIGIFPVLSIAMTFLFFPPNYSQKILRVIAEGFINLEPAKISAGTHEQLAFSWRKAVLAFVGVYCGLQILIPLRHWLYPGAVNWTEEGHRFAWHMKLREKSHDADFFVVHKNSGYVWLLDPEEYLTPRQILKMGARPDMILQYAHHIEKALLTRGYLDVAVHAAIPARLNNREPALLIDPNVDLTELTRSLKPAKWILPLGNTNIPPDWIYQAEDGPPAAEAP